MPLSDTVELQETIKHLFPGIKIETVVRPSGQRLVYFCSFSAGTDVEAQESWGSWGDVVLKISEDVHPSVIARLEKEAEILNSLNSPYFPKLLYCDVFREDPVTEVTFQNRLFVTIEERVSGAPLTECTHQYRDERAVVQLVHSLLDGMELLWSHPQKIVHRDLKPDNILVRPDGSTVIIDLGIIRETGSPGITATIQPMGPCTPCYASPEQLTNQKQFITHKSDFFSIGVIAYELLSGRNPFMGNPNEPLEIVADRVVRWNPPSLAELGVTSPKLSAIIQRLIAKEPYQRPRTVEQLRSDLNGINGS